MIKKARVLLFTPNLKGIGDGINRIQPSLGLMLIAQILIDNGHKVKFMDSALDGWNNRSLIDQKNNVVLIGQSNDKIEKVISDFSPDIVAISVLFSNLLESAHNIARLVKKVKKNTKVVLGGNHISSAVTDYKISLIDNNSNLPKKITDLENEHFDFGIIGEGEFSFAQLVNALINNDDICKVPGLVKKIGKNKYLINPINRVHDLNLLPRPARHLVDMEGYFKIGAFHSAKSRSKRVLNIMCSRGCPEKCTFCSTPEMWGSNIRWRSTQHIMDEINSAVENYKIGEIQFDDDTLTVNKKNLFSLCGKLEKLGIPWCTPNGTKVNYHFNKQKEMYKVMANSGCYQITLACESGVQRILDDIINKRLPLETIYPSIENAKKAGMLVHTFWILGYPGETYKDIQKTIDFALNSGADSFSFAILSPLPGTPIYRQVVKDKLWWEGKYLDDMLFRSSLIKVDGFNSADEFEKFVNETNKKANLLLKKKDPERFNYKYGENSDESALVKQT
jgi:magnesium-protoporphyrin IX monomethyl ester (oxidative) cyclase